jgi:hypothetical protein
MRTHVQNIAEATLSRRAERHPATHQSLRSLSSLSYSQAQIAHYRPLRAHGVGHGGHEGDGACWETIQSTNAKPKEKVLQYNKTDVQYDAQLYLKPYVYAHGGNVKATQDQPYWLLSSQRAAPGNRVAPKKR